MTPLSPALPLQEEEKLMRKLLAKVKAQAEAAEPAAAAEARQEEIAALKPIIDKYKSVGHSRPCLSPGGRCCRDSGC